METIRRGSRKTDDVLMLQDLLHRGGYDIEVDGRFGLATENTVKSFQQENGLIADGIVGSKTWRKLLSLFPDYNVEVTSRFLAEDDLHVVAKDLDVELAVIKAVNEVESSGQGFIGDKPKILFEGHVFWRQLKQHGLDPQDYRQGNENILFQKWTTGFYLGGIREYERLDKARGIHEDAALESASWGLFQIMGYHWESLGYNSVKAFVKLMYKSEGEHLRAFGRFVQENRLAGYLKKKQWSNFARIYNGPGYKKNKYDEKLERAYMKYKA